jgi:hypothetical protein
MAQGRRKAEGRNAPSWAAQWLWHPWLGWRCGAGGGRRPCPPSSTGGTAKTVVSACAHMHGGDSSAARRSVPSWRAAAWWVWRREAAAVCAHCSSANEGTGGTWEQQWLSTAGDQRGTGGLVCAGTGVAEMNSGLRASVVVRVVLGLVQ